MANPMKVLVPLTASQGAAISGSAGLAVQQGGLTVQSGGAVVTGSIVATQGITLSGTLEFTQESQIKSIPLSSGDGGASSTLQLIPDKDLLGTDQFIVVDPTSPQHIHLRAGGAIDASTADLFLGGEKANVQVTDGATHDVKIHSSGSATHEWVFGNNGILTQDGTAVATVSDVTSALAPYALSADVSSSFLAKSGGTITGNLVVDGTSSVSGPFLFSSSIEAGPLLSTSSLNDLTSSFYTIYQALGNMGPSAQSIQNSYDAIRFSNVNNFASNNHIEYFLAFENDIGQGTAATQDIAGDVFVTASAVQGVSGSTEAACLAAIGSLSIDVQTKDSGSVLWSNDLVSVQAAAQQSGSFWYPLITIDAPGLGEGNGANQVRLIVVNEATHAFVIPS
jgi:hypothetical protein